MRFVLITTRNRGFRGVNECSQAHPDMRNDEGEDRHIFVTGNRRDQLQHDENINQCVSDI